MERYSAAWFRRVLDSLDHFVLVKGDRSRLQWANQAFLQYYGMTNEQLKELVDSEHSDPDDTVQYVRDDHHVFSTGDAIEVVEPITRHDRTVQHFKTRKTAVRDEDGGVVGTVGISWPAQDEDQIALSTERRQQRKQALSILRELVGSMPTPVLVLDAQQRVVASSEELTKLLQLELTAGSDFGEALQPLLPIAPLLVEAASAGQTVSQQDVAVPRLSLRVNVDVRPWALPYGEQGGLLLTVTDVTESLAATDARDERNRALQAAREDQKVLVNAVQVGMVVVDGDGQFRVFNEAARRMLTRPGNDVVPNDWSRHFQIYRPDGVLFPTEDLPLSRAMRGEVCRDVLLEIRRPAWGNALWLNVSATPMSGTSRYAAVAVFHDVTRLIQVQKELEEFAFVASHDLREPLRMVTGFVELLAVELGDSASPEVQQYLGFAMDGARRMHSLIRDLLDVSRTLAEPLRDHPVDLQALVTNVVADHGALIAECDAHVVFNDLPTVHADGSQLGRVFANLLSNGLKFRDAARRPHVAVTAERTTTGWRIRVSDNGIGIGEDYRTRVFKMFQRLHARSEYEGNGIGLALCKRVVERHGGRMGIGANEPCGTTVWFDLPDARSVTTCGD